MRSKLGLCLAIVFVALIITPTFAVARAQKATWMHSVRLNPFSNIIYFNVNPGGWLNGYMDLGPVGWNPVLGKVEGGSFYFAIDVEPDMEPGYYDTLFIAGKVSTKDGYMIRTVDGMSYDGPDYIWLTPVAQSEEARGGIDITAVLGSEGLSPQAWYKFQLNPYSDVLQMNTNPGGWLNGYTQFPDHVHVNLGKAESGRFVIAMDFHKPQDYYAIGLVVGKVSTKDGYMIRTVDGNSIVGPEHVWLTPVP